MPIHILLLIAILLAATGDVSLAAANAIQFSDSFESGNLSKWRFSGNETTKVVGAPVRSGDYAVSMVVGPDDVVPYRSELVIASYDGQFPDHEEFWISLSFLVEDWGDVIPYWGTIFQIHSRPHQLPDGSGPDWSCNAGKNPITISTRDMELALNVVKNPDHAQLPGNGAIATEVWSKGLEIGKWYDWTFRYRSSLEEDGIIEAWVDGKKIYEQYGANRYLLDNCGLPTTPLPYMKIGIYREKGISSTQKLFMDEVYVYAGTDGFAAVQPPALRIIDTEKPSTPGGLVSSNITDTSFTVSWSPATDNVGVSAYTVFLDGQKMKTVTTPSLKFTKLDASTTYNIYIEATDQEGNISSRSPVLAVSTAEAVVPAEPVPAPVPVAEPVSPFVPISQPEETREPFVVAPTPGTPESAFVPYSKPAVYIANNVPERPVTKSITNEEIRAAFEKQASESGATTTTLATTSSTIDETSHVEIEPLPLPVRFYCYVMNIILSVIQSDLRCRQVTAPAD